MANSQETSGYSGQRHGGPVTGCSCFRCFSFGWRGGGEVEGHHFLFQERGAATQKEALVLAKFKKLATKIGELCEHMKLTNKRPNQFLYSSETYALNFAREHEEDEDGDLLHSFSSRFASHPLINDKQRRTAAL